MNDYDDQIHSTASNAKSERVGSGTAYRSDGLLVEPEKEGLVE